MTTTPPTNSGLPWQHARRVKPFVRLYPSETLLDQFVPHANQHEIHRELGQTPLQAQQRALAEQPSVLRPYPNCPWGPYV